MNAGLPDGGTAAADPGYGRVFFMWGNTLGACEGAARHVGRDEIQGVPAPDQPIAFRAALSSGGNRGVRLAHARRVLFRSPLAVP